MGCGSSTPQAATAANTKSQAGSPKKSGGGNKGTTGGTKFDTDYKRGSAVRYRFDY